MLKRKTKKRIVRGKKRKNGGAAAVYEPLAAASLDLEPYKKNSRWKIWKKISNLE